MKHLVSLAFVLAASSQLAGCIIVDDSGDDVSTRLDVTWQLKSGNTNATCRPDTAAATLWVCPGDCTNLNDAKGDVFTCTAGGGSVPAGGDPALAYPPGRYTAWMEFSTNSKQVYAKSFSQTVNLDAGGLTTARFDVQVDHGFFDVAWMLTKGAQVRRARRRAVASASSSTRRASTPSTASGHVPTAPDAAIPSPTARRDSSGRPISSTATLRRRTSTRARSLSATRRRISERL